jgi:hypothetical protein
MRAILTLCLLLLTGCGLQGVTPVMTWPVPIPQIVQPPPIQRPLMCNTYPVGGGMTMTQCN